LTFGIWSCIVDTINHNERATMTNTLKTTEIAEAVHAFALSGFDAQAMRPLMELVEAQTDYVQKRFWKLVDAQR
jgi:hypothetical protein